MNGANPDIRKYVGRRGRFPQEWNKLVDAVRDLLRNHNNGVPQCLFRFAVTMEGTGGTYPAAVDNPKYFPVKFLKADFARVTGSTTVNYDYLNAGNYKDADVLQVNQSYSSASYPNTGSAAINLYIPKGMVIPCYWQNGYWVTDWKDSYFVQTPTGGLPAKSGSTMGSAMCVLHSTNSSGVISSRSIDVRIWNPYSTAVAGNTIILTRPFGGHQVYDNEDCS